MYSYLLLPALLYICCTPTFYCLLPAFAVTPAPRVVHPPGLGTVRPPAAFSQSRYSLGLHYSAARRHDQSRESSRVGGRSSVCVLDAEWLRKHADVAAVLAGLCSAADCGLASNVRPPSALASLWPFGMGVLVTAVQELHGGRTMSISSSVPLTLRAGPSAAVAVGSLRHRTCRRPVQAKPSKAHYCPIVCLSIP